MSFTEKFWSEDQIDELKKRWWNGETITSISRAMGKSVSALRRKINALDLQHDPHLWKRYEHVIPPLKMPQTREDGTLVTVENCALDTECHWIEAEERLSEAPMCGRPVVGHNRFCAEHNKRAHITTSPAYYPREARC